MLISGKTALAASAQNDNLYSGSYIEFAPTDGRFHFGFQVGPTANITPDEVPIDVLCGGDAVAFNINAPNGAAMPIWPDHFLVNGLCFAGERVIAKARNKDAVNAADVYWAVIFEEAL